jgi:hypothetical protein
MGALLVFGVVCGVGDEGGFGFGLGVIDRRGVDTALD